MERHLLLTIGEDQSALYAARFVARFFSSHKDLRVTLFSSAPQAPAVWHEELNFEAKQQSELQGSEALRRSRQAVERAKAILKENGLAAEAIDDKVVGRRFTKALDIVQEAEQGLYDAVVLGRRGLTRLEEALERSVTRELLAERITFPIWVCRMPEVERKNVLLCVDGNAQALKAVDHVGFILGPETEHLVTLLYISPDGGELPGSYLEKCYEMLRDGGVSPERVSTERARGKALQTILHRAETGRFAAVALGRSHTGRASPVFGSLGDGLMRELTGATLWVCR